MKISYSHIDDCNEAKDINYRRVIKDKTGEITKGGMITTGDGMEEDRNIMIRTASITNRGGATILNREGAGIFKEGGGRITNRNGRVTGTMVKEVKVTGSSTTIKIASRDITMTDIKGNNLCL